MSSTASNYNVRRLYAGIVIAVMSLLTTVVSALPALLNARTTGVWLGLVTAIYGTMMFASSYVEEEHHFWYWVTSGWLGWLVLKR